MKSNSLAYFMLPFLLLIYTCGYPDPNINKTGTNALEAHEIENAIEDININYNDLIYIPIYSDIYVDQQNQSVLLAATLSIRNTSYSDTLYISKIDYFNTEGKQVKSYLDKPISLLPMATINYVIEKEDDSGGPGANFIVELSSTSKAAKPLIQAVMIGEIGNKGFSFSTDGYSVASTYNN